MRPNKQLISLRAKTRKEKEVWEACDTLRSKESPLTYYAIGEQLVQLGYKRGSNSDIRRYLSTWKKSHNISSEHLLTNSIQSHKDKVSLNIPNTHQSKSDITTLALATHYATQFDRLIKINELHRKENELLKHRIHKLHQQLNQTSTKPKIRLSAIFEKTKA